MKVSQEDIDFVEAKLQKQNAVLASVGLGLLTMPILLAWYTVFKYNVDYSPMMMLISGILIGLIVRWLGKGYSLQFAVMAFLIHLLISVSAFALGISFEGRLRGFLLFGLYAMGAWASIYLSRINIGDLKYKAFYQLTIANKHQSYKKLRNRWFLSLPLALAIAVPTALFSVSFVVQLHVMLTQEEAVQEVVREQQLLENKNIDVTPQGLAKYSDKQALIYAYAYYSGDLANNRGRYLEAFPVSEYKAKTILRYLATDKQNARAMFILGAISEGAESKKWIDQASELSDPFARYFTTVEFGCRYDEDEATKLLESRYRLAKEDALKFEIAKVFQYGFERMCQSEMRRFQYSYIRDY